MHIIASSHIHINIKLIRCLSLLKYAIKLLKNRYYTRFLKFNHFANAHIDLPLLLEYIIYQKITTQFMHPCKYFRIPKH